MIVASRSRSVERNATDYNDMLQSLSQTLQSSDERPSAIHSLKLTTPPYPLWTRRGPHL